MLRGGATQAFSREKPLPVLDAAPESQRLCKADVLPQAPTCCALGISLQGAGAAHRHSALRRGLDRTALAGHLCFGSRNAGCWLFRS